MILNRIMRVVLAIIGFALFYQVAKLSLFLLSDVIQWDRFGTFQLGTKLLIAAGGGLLGFLIAPWVVKKGKQIFGWVEGRLQRVSTQDMVYGVVGLIIGLLIALLLSVPFSWLPLVGPFLPVAAAITLGYLGARIAVGKREDLKQIFMSFPTFRSMSKVSKGMKGQCKILDTSVIIDGRIADICKSGFIEGTLIIPEFVLEELQHIADSSDLLKRNRGRRGLDILNKIQKELNVPVKIYEQDFEDISEVDSKLVKLAKMLDGKVLTNDYNLNKVAELQGVSVLNINELANAVKPVVLPGEEMSVHVIKDGKESGQGIAYLEDGTMIVVDGGRRYIGEMVDVVVTSVLQTAAGRMIFAKPIVLQRSNIMG